MQHFISWCEAPYHVAKRQFMARSAISFTSEVFADQILRSGTSIGANIHEANYASSKADFCIKLQIALKECYETDYWLDIFCESGIITAEEFDEMKEYCGKIRRMLISSITTAKKNSTERNQTNEA